MKILAVDTATSATAVALSVDGECAELRDDPPAGGHRGHATRLLPMAHQLLAGQQVGWDELDLIAVGTGPGGFTGLRVGVATARGVAIALGLMVAGRSSLAALARAALRESDATRALVLIDARRGEVFAQAFAAGEEPEPLAEPAALEPQDVPAQSAGTIVVGDGALRYRQHLALGGAALAPEDSPLHRVAARELAGMATYGALPAQVAPVYVREPDAEAAER